MFSIVRNEYLAWHGVGLNRGFTRGKGGGQHGDGLVRDGTKIHGFLSLSLSLSLSLCLSLCVRHTGVDSVKMISLVTLVESRIDPILISS